MKYAKFALLATAIMLACTACTTAQPIDVANLQAASNAGDVEVTGWVRLSKNGSLDLYPTLREALENDPSKCVNVVMSHTPIEVLNQPSHMRLQGQLTSADGTSANSRCQGSNILRVSDVWVWS